MRNNITSRTITSVGTPLDVFIDLIQHNRDDWCVVTGDIVNKVKEVSKSKKFEQASLILSRNLFDVFISFLDFTDFFMWSFSDILPVLESSNSV